MLSSDLSTCRDRLTDHSGSSLKIAGSAPSSGSEYQFIAAKMLVNLRSNRLVSTGIADANVLSTTQDSPAYAAQSQTGSDSAL